MLCYSCLEKRGDCIKKFINWQLFNNNEVVVNNENVECEFNNNVLKYKEDNNTVNIIDLNNDTYVRENNEFTFKIDFKNRCFVYILKENDYKISDVLIKAELIKNNDITLIYSLENEEKKIIIHIL